MQREVTIILCDECEAELHRSDRVSRLELHEALWWVEQRPFCGEACARAFFDRQIAAAEDDWQASKADRVAA